MKIEYKIKKVKLSREEAQVLKDRIKFQTNIAIQNADKDIIEGLLSGKTLTLKYKTKVTDKDKGKNILNFGEIEIEYNNK